MRKAVDETDTRTILMFSESEMSGPPIEELIETAKESVKNVFKAGQVACILFSGGKDSSVVSNLVLTAAAEFVREGGVPRVIVLTGNTLVENPEVVEHYQGEHRKMMRFAKECGFKLQIRVASPSLMSSFTVKVLSGRGIPTFPGSRTSDCTSDLKIMPIRSVRRALMKEFEGAEAVAMLGTRFSESERRAAHMKARGERHDVPVRNKDGELVLSVISRWRTEDVWEYVGLCSSGLIETFSDMTEMSRIYAHASGTSCAVVAEAIEEGVKTKKRGGCTARTGCFICQQAEDKSLAQMVEFEPERYGYAAGLVKLNQFIRNTRFDWRRRHWIGRTIKNGWICVEPDSYHPTMVRELSRYMLQLDHDERVRARRSGERPKFQIIGLEALIAIDALQSLNGLARPFSMWADLRAIENGQRFDIPNVDPVPPTPMPEPRFLFVGDEWETEVGESVWGLRSPYIESLLEISNCKPELMTTSKGHLIWEVQSQKGFEVDPESAVMIEDFEKDRLLEMYDKAQWLPGGIKSGYEWYALYGALKLDHAQRQHHDEVARRTEWKDQRGLTLDYDIDEVYGRAKRFSEMPAKAREAWGAKATDAGAQMDFLDVLGELEEVDLRERIDA